MESTDRQEPSAVIWNWRGEERARRLGFGPSSPIFQAIIIGLIACLFFWRGHHTASKVVGTVAATVLVVWAFAKLVSNTTAAAG